LSITQVVNLIISSEMPQILMYTLPERLWYSTLVSCSYLD
jgi:hypothetical protein